jgi:RIO-like serine/threonine protein kinase
VWFLPTVFIVKELDPAKPDSFFREGETYARLQHLQGYTIPIHYGTVEIEHPGELERRKAHLIELVTGIPLSECTREQSIEYRSKAKIDEALALLSEMNVVQGDPAPRHFIHTANGGLRIIDFGEAYMDDDADKLNRGDAENAMYWFLQKFDT